MQCSWSIRLQPRHVRTNFCPAVSRSKLPSAATRAAAIQPQQQYIFDIDAVVSGLHQLSTHWAFAAASTAFKGAQIPGTPELYQRYMQQLLPVVRHPYEAVLLLRLLADEGIVGGCKDTSGTVARSSWHYEIQQPW